MTVTEMADGRPQESDRCAGRCYGKNMEKPNREKLMSGKMTSHMKLGSGSDYKSTFPNVRRHLWPQASKILVKKEEPKIGYGTIYNTTLTNTNIEIHTESVDKQQVHSSSCKPASGSLSDRSRILQCHLRGNPLTARCAVCRPWCTHWGATREREAASRELGQRGARRRDRPARQPTQMALRTVSTSVGGAPVSRAARPQRCKVNHRPKTDPKCSRTSRAVAQWAFLPTTLETFEGRRLKRRQCVTFRSVPGILSGPVTGREVICRGLSAPV